MRDRLEQELFPFVIKPGRYAGGEPGQIIKDAKDRVNYLHAYPDKYDLGMSYVGLQSLYHIINADDRFLCERVFTPDTDAAELMREKNLPLFSLETGRSAREFDAVGFTLVDETVYTNVLFMLDLAGIPLRSAERSDDDPIIMAGGPAAFNPEPLANFIDLFFIGDAEEGLLQMLAVLGEHQDASRQEKLEQICRQVESVYVPALYDENRKPVVDFAPAEIKACILPELKPEYYPEQPLVPLVETAHDHLGVEIMRGCPQGCRFCMAGGIYRPVRARPKDDVLQQVDTQLRNTGYAEITLLSLSSSDYPEIEPLTAALARRVSDQGINISLPSLRPGTITPTLLDAVSRVRKSGLTIAPEAGTERLRLFIRKDFPDAAIYDTVRMALRRNWKSIKLYFMIGLPTETEDDRDGIVDVCRRIVDIAREFQRRVNINVTLSPFNAKPHTPFQWDGMLSEEEVFHKISQIKRKARLNQVNIKYPNTKLAMLVGVLGRGDRRMGDVIESAYKLGCRFENWSESFDYDRWLEAFRQNDISIEDCLKPIPFSRDLPWSHIRKGPSVEHLQKERHRTSSQLKDYTPFAEPDQDMSAEPQAAGSFGRGKKKVASRSTVAPTKNRVRVHWGKSERCRYLSHLDNLRVIERALRKARLPVAYSQGHNPTMKLSFGPPLPLGFTSSAEYVDITLEQNLMGYMVEAFRDAVPEGIQIFDASVILTKSKSLTALLNRVEYRIPADRWTNREVLENGTSAIMKTDTLEVERTTKSNVKTIDIRPAIYDLRIEQQELVMTLGIGDGGYARPGEIVQQLQEGLTVAVEAVPYHRSSTYRIDDTGARIDPMDL